MTKRCASCLVEKNSLAFGIERRTKTGLHARCKACRAIKNANLTPEQLEMKRASNRRYYRAHTAECLARNEACRLRRRATQYEIEIEKHRQAQKRWKLQNPELARAGEKRRQSRVPKAKLRAYVRRWREKDLEHARALGRRKEQARRGMKRSVFIEVVDPRAVFQRDHGICGICHLRVEAGAPWHMDHIVPLAAGGVHAYANIQVAHASCNLRKGARAA